MHKPWPMHRSAPSAGAPQAARAHFNLDLLVVRELALSLAQRTALRDRFESSEVPFRLGAVEGASSSGLTAGRVALERVPL